MHKPIKIESLSLSFPSKTCFETFSTEIHHGSRIAIIGRNGCGKSSLLNLLRGVGEPTSGRIYVPGDAIMGYVPQVITDFADLSGGERLNRALTQALSLQPNILLLDEPTNHLDERNRRHILRWLEHFHGSLLIVSHDKAHPLLLNFKDLTGPRAQKHSLRHKLIDILMLTIIAVICGADNWVAVEKFGRSKYEWLKTFLELPHGIPSHDIIGDLFSRLNPKELQESFLKWINAVFKFTGGQIIAIDGKTLRHSYDTAKERAAIHMISAWCCKNNLVLGQVKISEKSNEITAIPELLKMLDLKGHIVTIDAMGCQKKIAQQIVEGGGDYVFNLKGNQSTLHDDVRLFIESYVDEKKLIKTSFDQYEVIDGDHGRIDTRRYWITEDIEWLKQKKDWAGLKSIGMVEYESMDKITGKLEIERRCFISSMKAQAKSFSQAVRLHWGIENGLHWCLDVAFNEDDCRVRKDYAPENFAVIRHIALNLLKNEKTAKTGIKNKRLMAGWDHGYLAKLLDTSMVE